MNAPIVTATPTDSIDQVLAAAAAALAAAGINMARLDAEVLLAAACGLDRTALYLRGREPVPHRCREVFGALLRRRVGREPLQYIVGRQEFWSLDFAVTPDVLIPRPETELLVEVTLSLVQAQRPAPTPIAAGTAKAVCDLGTGSGCIAVALARELPDAQVWALDISAPALILAQENARRHRVAERIRFLESNLLAGVSGQRFDVIVSNPPYVSADELDRLQPEVRWEPRRALDGGAAGLDIIEAMLAAAPAYLAEGGWLVMEIGATQGPAVQVLVRRAGFNAVSVRSDYAGLPRILVARQ